jgi:cytochrome oxidase Cu insertion factor (SCO1/SenC/PrrC family)
MSQGMDITMNQKMDAEEPNSEVKGNGRGGAQLLVLMLVFGLPMIFSWVLYYNPDLLPGGRSNKGELIQPVRPIPDQLYQTMEGGSFSKDNLQGYWTLMLSAGTQCGDACQQRIYDMRQIRKAMAEHHSSVQRLVVMSTLTIEEALRQFMQDYTGTTVLIGDSTSLAPLHQQMALDSKTSEGYLYLIDPVGNMMMRYHPQQPAAEVLSDMELLLKVNKWGGGH